MLQELAAATGASTWAVVSMLFFVAVYVIVAVRTWRAKPEDLEAQARLALDTDAPSAGAGTQA